MKRAQAWTEEVAFVECPHCEETETLGSGLIFGDDEPATCTFCGKEYFLIGPRDEEDKRRDAMEIGRRGVRKSEDT